MKYNSRLMVSTVALAILTTGCVKKTTNEPAVVYDNSQPTYESGAPIVYETTGTPSSSGVTYTEVPTDNTVITTTDAYGQPITSSTTSPAASSTGAYNNPYGTDTTYPNPYDNQPIVDNYPTSSTTAQGGGLHLQIAALKDYYAAEEFRKGLSLDPKYSSYVIKGAVNKVVISGITSRSEANDLKERRFPGAFIISGSATSATSSSGYTTNTPYTTTNTSTMGQSGIGVQIGAFSTHSKAQSVANSASSRYTPYVKRGNINGKTIYKAILTGFSSEQEARSFIAQRGGVGFIVHGF